MWVIKRGRLQIGIICLLWALLVLVAFRFSFHNLGAHSISLRSDEVIYTRVVQEMVHDNHWWRMRHGSVPFADKPPLKMWVSALAVKAFGESNVSYRLVDAIAGFSTVLLIAWFGSRLFSNVLAGVLAGLLLCASPILFTQEHSFRKAVQDGALIFCVSVAAILAYLLVERIRRKQRALLLSGAVGVAVAAAILIKSIAGLLPLFILALFILTDRDRHLLIKAGRKEFVLVAVLALGIPLTYFVPQCLAVPLAYQKLFSGELTRVVHGFREHNASNPWYYPQVLFIKGYALPVLTLLAALIYGSVRAFFRPEVRFLLIWALLPPVLYSFAGSRVPWYIAPSFPGMALLAAVMLVNCTKTAWHYAVAQSRPILAPILLLMVLLDGYSLFSVLRGYIRIDNYIETKESTRLPLDTAIEKLKSHPGSIYVFRNALSGRANPIKGRFNVEGFYRGMVKERIINISARADLVSVEKEKAFLVIRSGEIGAAPGGIKSFIRIPAFNIRKDEILILSYGDDLLTGFSLWGASLSQTTSRPF